jgi:hypothetical protein
MRCPLPLAEANPGLAKYYVSSMSVLPEFETGIYAVFKNNSTARLEFCCHVPDPGMNSHHPFEIEE